MVPSAGRPVIRVDTNGDQAAVIASKTLDGSVTCSSFAAARTDWRSKHRGDLRQTRHVCLVHVISPGVTNSRSSGEIHQCDTHLIERGLRRELLDTGLKRIARSPTRIRWRGGKWTRWRHMSLLLVAYSSRNRLTP